MGHGLDAEEERVGERLGPGVDDSPGLGQIGKREGAVREHEDDADAQQEGRPAHGDEGVIQVSYDIASGRDPVGDASFQAAGHES